MFFFYFYISSLYIVPLLSPGTITGLYIYIEREEKLILQCYAMQGEVSPGRGFSSGALHAAKWGLEMFWGKCLKLVHLQI